MREYSVRQKRRVESTLQNKPFYCMIHGRHGDGMTFSVYRIMSDLKGEPRLMKFGILGHTIYHSQVISVVRKRLLGKVLIGKPTWKTLCNMTDDELLQLIHTTDTHITMTVMCAREELGC